MENELHAILENKEFINQLAQKVSEIIKNEKVEEKEKKIPEGKTDYLQLIQEPIGRMSTISSIFKGFAATIVAGIAMISYSSTNVWVLILAFIPTLIFAALDTYYLQLERKFRRLYENVCNGKKIDFSINPNFEGLNKKANCKEYFSCFFSLSIWPFYAAMSLVLVGVILLKCFNAI